MKVLQIIMWVLTFLIMVTIFSFSSQVATSSNKVSNSVTQKVVNIIPKTKKLPQSEKQKLIKKWNNIIRKYAHFTLFLLLGIFSMLSMICSFKHGIFKSWIFVLLFCLLYAISDEIHQIFVPGRGSQFKDVAIDFLGSFTGSIVIFIVKFLNKKYIKGL